MFNFKTPGFLALAIAGSITLVGGSALSLFPVIGQQSIFSITAIAITLNLFTYVLIYIGLLFGSLVTKSHTNYINIANNSFNYRFATVFVGVLFLIGCRFVNFHVLGSLQEKTNTPIVEGVLEILMRYVIPSIGVYYIFCYKKSDTAFIIAYGLLVVYTIYIDIFIKMSKQVFITYIFIYLMCALLKKTLSLKKVVIIIGGVSIVASFVFFSRIIGFDYIQNQSSYNNYDLIKLAMHAVYERTVAIPETSKLLSSGVNLFRFSVNSSENASVANLYTRDYYGFPLGSNTSFAPGVTGFLLYLFGLSGVILALPLGIAIHLLYYFNNRILGKSLMPTVCIDLLLIYLFTDGVLDERLFSLFPIKLLVVNGIILMSEKTYHKLYLLLCKIQS